MNTPKNAIIPMLPRSEIRQFVSALNKHAQLQVLDENARDIFTVSNINDPGKFDFVKLDEFLRREEFECDGILWDKLFEEFLGDEFRSLVERIGAGHIEIARKPGKVYAISVSGQDFLDDLEAIWVKQVVRDAVEGIL